MINVPLNKITDNPWQTRLGEPDSEYIESLALDIAQNGLLQLPVDWGVVRNLARLEPKAQVRLATRFANSGATSRYIGIALKRVLDDPQYGREKADQAPAERVTKKRQIKESAGGHWNMIAQLQHDHGLELEERYREVAAETCRDCDLYDFASSNTCRECPAVDLLKRLNGGK